MRFIEERPRGYKRFIGSSYVNGAAVYRESWHSGVADDRATAKIELLGEGLHKILDVCMTAAAHNLLFYLINDARVFL